MMMTLHTIVIKLPLPTTFLSVRFIFSLSFLGIIFLLSMGLITTLFSLQKRPRTYFFPLIPEGGVMESLIGVHSMHSDGLWFGVLYPRLFLLSDVIYR